MFNESNVNNRLRRLVRGRVIVFTTSRKVEFLNDNLSFSIPLYSFPQVTAESSGYVFVIEASGFLTFDEGSVVRISDEMGTYRKFWFDPNGAKLVQAADPFPSFISYVFIVDQSYDSATSSNVVVRALVNVNTSSDQMHKDQYHARFEPGLPEADVLALFPIDSLFRGINGYGPAKLELNTST